jgi:hypothetical protein
MSGVTLSSGDLDDSDARVHPAWWVSTGTMEQASTPTSSTCERFDVVLGGTNAIVALSRRRRATERRWLLYVALGLTPSRT